MKAIFLLLPVLAFPVTAVAQLEPPPNMAATEIARSQACVPGLARLIDLEERVEPLSIRASRIQALAAAIDLEDAERVEPFSTDPVEAAVQAWFAEDLALARSGSGEAIEEQRRMARERIRGRLVEALQELNRERNEILEAAGDFQEVAFQCGGAILVRSAVLETCRTASGVVCDAARSEEVGGPIRFVDDAEDLWDVEELRPWTRPSALRIGQDGQFAGARTAAYNRRGNLVMVLSLETMLVERSALSQEEIEGFEEHLSEMGFNFRNPRFVMAPGLGVYFEAAPEPLGGETHYILHFGNLQDPDNDIIWSAPYEAGTIEVTFAPGESTFSRLMAGEIVSLTAMTLMDGEDEEGALEGTPIFSLDVITMGQADSVRSLLTYIGGGQLARDLERLVPTETGSR